MPCLIFNIKDNGLENKPTSSLVVGKALYGIAGDSSTWRRKRYFGVSWSRSVI